MIYRSSLLLFLSLLLVVFISACSIKTGVDPVRPTQSVNAIPESDFVSLQKLAGGSVEITAQDLKHSLVFYWENDGLVAENNGSTVYDLNLMRNGETFSFGIVETGMITAPLNIPLEYDVNKFEIEFSLDPMIEINKTIIHTDGFDISHAVTTDVNDGYIDNEVLFGFVDGTSNEERHRIIRDHGIFLTGINTATGMHVGRIDDGRTPFEVIDELSQEPSVKWPFINGLVFPANFPNDPVWYDWWPDDYRWAMQRIHAQEAWDIYNDGELDGKGDASVDKIVLCISDTGVHPHYDFNLDTFDQWVAYNYSENFMYPGVPPLDYYGHGTSVAGIAGAMGNNNSGLAGVCWDAYFLSLKCLGDGGPGSWEAVGDSIAYVGEVAQMFPFMKFIANYSLGGGTSDPWVEEATIYADQFENTLLIGAAGNWNWEYADSNFPAAFEQFVSVGASSIYQDGELDKEVDSECGWGTNWGTTVDVCAPGSNYITTTNIPWNVMYNYTPPDCPWTCYTWYCDHFSGTSSATPHVVGLAALLWNKYPEWTKLEVRQKIKDTADPMSLPPNKVGKLGTGRINCYRALTE